jgi:hypothetical protein
VRSEAEFQSIMAQLQGGDKQAVIPPMLVGLHQAPPFLDDNGRVHDCAALLRERQVQMRWSSTDNRPAQLTIAPLNWQSPRSTDNRPAGADALVVGGAPGVLRQVHTGAPASTP